MADVHAQSADGLDFLPLKYRQNQTGHRATARWLLAMSLCIAVLATASWIQYHARIQIHAEIADVRKQHQRADAQTQTLAALKATKRKLNDEAELYTYLRHPWPRTNLLATIASAMPESIVLTELHVTRTQPVVHRRPDKSLEKAQNDLTQLHAAYDETQVHVAIEGLTQDIAQLHSQFIGPLGGSPLFETSTLQFVKRDDSIGNGVSRFRVELVVRQGYGSSQCLPDSVQTAASRRVDRNTITSRTDKWKGASWKE